MRIGPHKPVLQLTVGYAALGLQLALPAFGVRPLAVLRGISSTMESTCLLPLFE